MMSRLHLTWRKRLRSLKIKRLQNQVTCSRQSCFCQRRAGIGHLMRVLVFPHYGPGSIPVWCLMWAEHLLVFNLLLGFFTQFFAVPLFWKQNDISKFQFDPDWEEIAKPKKIWTKKATRLAQSFRGRYRKLTFQINFVIHSHHPYHCYRQFPIAPLLSLFRYSCKKSN